MTVDPGRHGGASSDLRPPGIWVEPQRLWLDRNPPIDLQDRVSYP
jgi:hypothetical protein